jgi:hypothetical protein
MTTIGFVSDAVMTVVVLVAAAVAAAFDSCCCYYYYSSWGVGFVCFCIKQSDSMTTKRTNPKHWKRRYSSHDTIESEHCSGHDSCGRKLLSEPVDGLELYGGKAYFSKIISNENSKRRNGLSIYLSDLSTATFCFVRLSIRLK